MPRPKKQYKANSVNEEGMTENRGKASRWRRCARHVALVWVVGRSVRRATVIGGHINALDAGMGMGAGVRTRSGCGLADL